MKTILFLFLVSIILGPCPSHAGEKESSIRVGMTREQIATASSPLKYVASDGVRTYLIDIDDLKAVSMVDDKVILYDDYWKVTSAYSSPSVPEVSNFEIAKQSGLRIISITPNSVPEGQSVSVKVRIAYRLAESRPALIALGFNGESQQSFIMVAKQAVQPGSGEIEMTGLVTPKARGSLSPFTASAVLILGTGDDVERISHSNRDIAITPKS